MKIIDSRTRNAFRRMREALGTNTRVAEELNLSVVHIGRILSGVTIYLEDKTWDAVQEKLAPYMDSLETISRPRPSPNRKAETLSPIDRVDPNWSSSEVAPVDDRIFQTFPVISDASAASCNTSLFPIADWADANAEQRVSFSAGRNGDFVIRVSGESMMPWYPPGTLILARPNKRLKSGDRVIAVLADGSVVFKVFVDEKDEYHLYSINGDDGLNYDFRKDDYAAIRAIYLVIQSMRDERALDYAMAKKGIRHFWQTKLEEKRAKRPTGDSNRS